MLWPCDIVLHATNLVVLTINAFSVLQTDDVGSVVVDTTHQLMCSLFQTLLCDSNS